MATAKPFKSMPFPLGKIAPPTPGTPLPITNNFTDLGAEAVNSLWIQALASNTQPVYVLCQTTATGKDTTGYANIAFVLTSGQATVINGKYANQVMLGNFWIDPTAGGEGVFVVIQEI